MAAILKGLLKKFKVPENAKPGDEIEVSGEFEADQDDYEQSLDKRLKSERKKAEDLQKQLEKANKDLEAEKKKSTGTPEPSNAANQAILDRLDAQEKQAKRDRQEAKLQRILDQKAKDLPDAMRRTINVPDDADDETIEAAVERVNKEFEKLKLDLGVKKQKPNVGTGAQGSGSGSTEEEAEKATVAGLLKKANTNRPDLIDVLNNSAENEKDMGLVLKDWDSKGLLDPKK